MFRDAATMISGIGCDLLAVDRMERELLRAGYGFRDSVFTPAEIAHCSTRSRPALRFAQYFTAKEAVFKALGLTGRDGFIWKQIEIVAGRGPRQVVLHGRALARARELGVSGIHLSMTHTDRVALAKVVLESTPVEMSNS